MRGGGELGWEMWQLRFNRPRGVSIPVVQPCKGYQIELECKHIKLNELSYYASW